MTTIAAARLTTPWWLRANAGLAGVLVLIGAVYTIGATVSDRFLSLGNLLNVYEQTTDLALVSIGQTLTILSGGIDLSVGSLISLTSCLTSGLINGNPDRVAPVVIGVLALGTLVGVVNAGLVVALRVHPLIVTLGMGAILQGMTLLYALGPVGRVPRDFSFVAYGRIAGIPIGATIAVILCVLVALLLRYLPLGRQIYALGDDDNSARLVGLRRTRILMLVYGASGFCCAATGLYLAARFGVGQPYTGVNYTLASITPVVLGGTLLSGGKGGVIGTLFGAFLIALLNNLLNFMDVSKHYQLVAQAVIIILAVSVYIERRRLG
ncbi:ABC transporter permease [Bradyrhizobium sp. CCGUVB4N]|uniref:ABC transporter permease n=1 Tax=Bradyrhizobium sp. CCGUVB4N TaxID=2949631 RepID=UPI0020B44910|nr:ABC transporter permease [Bradyrhizobium sp. CCGUVB4N]MCP3383202.1 ABC transporter permease [Bradyrhizobium sp. CCGUVB4N]